MAVVALAAAMTTLSGTTPAEAQTLNCTSWPGVFSGSPPPAPIPGQTEPGCFPSAVSAIVIAAPAAVTTPGTDHL